MVLEESLELPVCAFCLDSKNESDLFEMSTNSIILENEIIEFSEIISNLFENVCVYIW